MHPYGALQYVIQHVVHNIICLGIAVRLGSDASASAQVLEQQLNTLPPLLTIVWQCQTGTHHSYNCVSVFLCVCLFVALVQMCLCFFRKLWSPFDIASRCWCFFVSVEYPCSLFSFQDVNNCGYFSQSYSLSFVCICVSVSYFGLS